MIEWLAEHRSEDREFSNMYYGAVTGGHLDVVQYLLDINEPIRSAHMRVMTWSPLTFYQSIFDRVDLFSTLSTHSLLLLSISFK
ncbi:hypothetical protein PPL_00186 [Heterostelium album PN500]|uniref:Ankyrin repeat protein n=1 Tax=Heterostelium pallidum (strain ATCC 26659 / Pp 5 / PN500) TaxID=670386 RepID=D3AVS1_HETP5|nr:hypothetical protein PPL_00186 [Heterostelium album PN500]EFA86394.1 hypothetical protein PPL_00186 [Heterostelium album PN500]|eukprot:XP_020438499.1 hypothetical protein PPL_00186 [Heterostelium album PN500]